MRNLIGLVWAVCGLLAAALPASARDIALIIANSNYAEMGVLKNPANDMNRMTSTLSSLGFEVRRATDLRRDQMAAALLDFAREARGAETAMVFYSGHGFEADGINYLIPVDYAPRHPADVKFAAIKLDDVMEAVAGATRLSVVVLDACRNNPLAGTRGGGRGLARVTARPSQVVAYSTAPGQVAQDGIGGVSPYTQALSEMMQSNPAMDVRRLFTSLSSRTTQLAQTEQVPYAEFGAFNANHVSLTGAVPQGAQPQPAPSAQPSSAEMLALWDAIKDSKDADALENFERSYPESPLAMEAQRRRLAMVQQPATAPTARPTEIAPSAVPPNKKGLLPHISQVPPTNPLSIDGVWTAEFNGAQFRIEKGRIYALTPYSHLVVLPIEKDDVVVRGVRQTGVGQYTGFDMAAQAQWNASLQRDGSLAVKIGVLFSTTLRPERLDNGQWHKQELGRLYGIPASPQPAAPAAAVLRPQPSAVPNPAAPYDGAYILEMSCEAVRGNSASAFRNQGTGFVEEIPVTVSSGRFTAINGAQGANDYYRMDGTVSPSGDVEISGEFHRDGTRKRIRFTSGSTLKASGRRGRAYCEVSMRKS